MECNGKAKALPSAIELNFVGLRFREFCLSVMVHRDENGSQQEGFYFAAAWNSSRAFAVIERACFSTPYRYGNVYAEPAEARVSPASHRLARPTKERFWLCGGAVVRVAGSPAARPSVPGKPSLVFVPCKQVIVDRDDQSVSCISLWPGGIKAHPVAGTEQPESEGIGAVSLAWAVATNWLRLPGEEGRTFQQRIQIATPEGAMVGNAVSDFVFALRAHNNVVKGDAFPIGRVGEYTIVLSLRSIGENAEEGDWEEFSRFPVEVVIVPQERTGE